MYNFRNLNDYEFELLCKDVMEKKMGIPLRVRVFKFIFKSRNIY
jgi:hypothetical protein